MTFETILKYRPNSTGWGGIINGVGITFSQFIFNGKIVPKQVNPYRVDYNHCVKLYRQHGIPVPEIIIDSVKGWDAIQKLKK